MNHNVSVYLVKIANSGIENVNFNDKKKKN